MITNIDVGAEFQGIQGTADIMYQTFDKMAMHFGRDMKLHRHDGFYQMFFLDAGHISLMLGVRGSIVVKAPMFVVFPPSLPHAFFTRDDTHGHAVTVSKTLLDPLLSGMAAGSSERVRVSLCYCPLQGHDQDLQILRGYFDLIAGEAAMHRPGQREVLENLTRAMFIYVFRHICQAPAEGGQVPADAGLFIRFNTLIDCNYRSHWTVHQYASTLGISYTRLKKLCQAHIRKSPKSLIFDKLMTEAEHLLAFTNFTVAEISDHLGFKDASYFSRFFMRMTHTTPSVWRRSHSHVTYL